VASTTLGTLVDSNVLLDYLTEDDEWSDWSAVMLVRSSNAGPVFINPIIYAEVSVRFDSVEDLDEALVPDYFVRVPVPWDAAFLAGKCFERYRRSGGTRRSPLPDFFIGAHAAVKGFTLLTRDAQRYRAYFPKLKIIAP
jgi:predicted nucleic acid-binding protein